MKLSCYLALGLLAFASCKAPLNRVTRAENLPLHEVTVNVDRDTVLVFPEGLKITIPAGALSSKNKEAKLEIIEALTIEDMIRAGLTATTNGRLLSSGGMFCILPAKGQEVSIKQPLTVDVPASKISDGMQLYQGIGINGQMDWEFPEPIVDSNNTSQAMGKLLFEQNCSSCHAPLEKVTGPALYHVMDRWDNDTASVNAFVRNSANVMTWDLNANCLFNQYNKTVMTAFPALADNEIASIIEYVELEGRKGDTLAITQEPMKGCDPCDVAKSLEASLLKEINENNRTEKFVTLADNRTVDTIYGSGKIAVAGQNENGEERKPKYYTIKIKNFGWKNIDEETRNIASTRACKLSVTLTQPADPSMHIFLVIPDDRIFSLGGLLADGKSYGFYGIDSMVYLPLNKSAYVLAVAEGDKKFRFGMTSFTTDLKQDLKLDVKDSDPKLFEEAIAKIGADKGLSATVNKITVEDVLPKCGPGATLQEKYAYWKQQAAKCNTGQKID